MNNATERHQAAIDKAIARLDESMGRKESWAETYGLIPFSVTFVIGLGVLIVHRFLS
ncbi:hypothetical protein [Pseudomonas sp. TE3610]